MILYLQMAKNPRNDTKFSIITIRSLKKYNADCVIAYEVCDSKHVRRYMNEEIKSLD